MTQPSPAPKTIEDRFREEVLDAVELLEFAVETGRSVDDTIVDRIKKAQSYFKTPDQVPTDADRADFEKTYRDLAKAMSPINIQTLRATADGRPGGARGWVSRVVFPRSSDAKVFSKQLWVWVVGCALVIVFTQVISQIYVPDEESASSGMSWYIAFAKPLLPFVHGLLGALTCLMRSAHNYIAERSFDLKRTPEYYNRMLLGFVVVRRSEVLLRQRRGRCIHRGLQHGLSICRSGAGCRRRFSESRRNWKRSRDRWDREARRFQGHGLQWRIATRWTRHWDN
jgi:hypothetical protein